MKVLKFGGTSVGTVTSLTNVKHIVEKLDQPAVVIVSALGGLTDKLISTASLASSGDDTYKQEMGSIRERHFNIIEGVVDRASRPDCIRKVSTLLDELEKLYDGVRLIGDLPEKTLNNIVSFGERISSVIVSAMLPGSIHLDSLEYIKTEKWFGKDIADTKLTTQNITDNFHPEHGHPIIAGGFIAKDRDSGEITNLGRGGSDFTAALVAAALDAEVLEIWTDVDGFMTSDPRIIKDARIIPIMSFVESMELCSFGAKVIYPPTIYPVFHKNIPIKILNTFNITAEGTTIKDFNHKDLVHYGKVRGLSALKDTAIITIHGSLAQNVAAVSSRTFNVMAKNGISVFLVSPTDENDIFSFSLRSFDLKNALSLIHNEFSPEISSGLISNIGVKEGLSLIAIVGEEILSEGYISPRIINTLERSNVSPVAISEGASRTTVTFAVPEEDTNMALDLIHSLFFN